MTVFDERAIRCGRKVAMCNFPFIPVVAWLALTGHCLAAELEWVRVADDNRSFVLDKSGHEFVPWGPTNIARQRQFVKQTC